MTCKKITGVLTRNRITGYFKLKGPQELSSPMACSKQDQLWDQTGLLRALFSQVFKTSKDGDDTTSLGKVFQCLTVLMVKRISLWWLRREKKQVGNEVPTRCYRHFTANSGMLIPFFTSTKLLHSSYTSPDYPGYLPCDGHYQVNADSCLFLLYSCPFLFLCPALRQRRLQPCSRSDKCPVDLLEMLQFTYSIRTQSSHAIIMTLLYREAETPDTHECLIADRRENIGNKGPKITSLCYWPSPFSEGQQNPKGLSKTPKAKFKDCIVSLLHTGRSELAMWAGRN